jgi:hypothetical protein
MGRGSRGGMHMNDAATGVAAIGAEGEGTGRTTVACRWPVHARAGDWGKKSPDRRGSRRDTAADGWGRVGAGHG